MKPDFTRVQREHVLAAVERIGREGVPPHRRARSTVVSVDGQAWPAKYLLGLAWEAATGTRLDPDDYTGGLSTARVLRALGFDVERAGEPLPGAATASSARDGRGYAPAGAAHGCVVASVAMTGDASKGTEDNGRRAALLRDIAGQLVDPERPGDAAVLVLPGGYFRLDVFVGNLTSDARKACLNAASFSAACRDAASRLDAVVPGAVLVVGVDSVEGPSEWADQMAVAWRPTGVAGVGRKVFPVAGGEAAGLVVNAEDFGDSGRVVELPGGRRGVLCSCYDGFGVSDPRRRARPIERLRIDGRVVRHTDTGFDGAWEEAVSAWTDLIDGVDAALVAIHSFGGRGNTSMWQRHGIATASAALGGLALAGAHFERLPRHEDVQTLSAADVPVAHLTAGHHRRAESLAPIAAARMGGAMVRWFAWG